MGQSKKEILHHILSGKKAERIPVGFWFHFLEDEIHSDAFHDPSLDALRLKRQEEYIDQVHPDFVKIMTDGFFGYGNPALYHVKSAADIQDIQPLAEDDPWFVRQIEFARSLTDRYGRDLDFFYNIFCFGTTFAFMQEGDGEEFLAQLIREEPEVVKKVSHVVSGDLARLSRRLIQEAHVTGIYFSLRNIKGISRALYERVIEADEKYILNQAHEAGGLNILHICGYEGHRNDISWYRDYDFQAVNWAVDTEKIPLGEGRRIFKGKTVMGGFGNTDKDVLYRGSREQVEEETERIIREAGSQSLILGADCTVPRDIDIERFEWVRSKAASTAD
jgi:uroporphyrinogen decarboxylase